MRATAFAELLEVSWEAGTSRFSATNVANALGLQFQDLATLARVHRNTVRTHPESPRLQAALCDLMRVLSAAVAKRAFFMLKNEPISAFRHKTLLQLVQDGRTEDAMDYLESISARASLDDPPRPGARSDPLSRSQSMMGPADLLLPCRTGRYTQKGGSQGRIPLQTASELRRQFITSTTGDWSAFLRQQLPLLRPDGSRGETPDSSG